MQLASPNEMSVSPEPFGNYCSTTTTVSFNHRSISRYTTIQLGHVSITVGLGQRHYTVNRSNKYWWCLQAICKSWLLMNIVQDKEEWIPSPLNESTSNGDRDCDCYPWLWPSPSLSVSSQWGTPSPKSRNVWGQQIASEEFSNHNKNNNNEGLLLGAHTDDAWYNKNNNNNLLLTCGCTKPTTTKAAYCLRFYGVFFRNSI
jgi:hypothetical protein